MLLDDFAKARLYTFLSNNIEFAINQGYLVREFLGYTVTNGRRVAQFDYRMTQKAIDELGFMFAKSFPERLKRYAKKERRAAKSC